VGAEVTWPRASVVIVMHNAAGRIRACLDAVLAQDLPAQEYEVIVVDNGSRDAGVEIVRSGYPQITLLTLDANYGFAGGNNRGARLARGAWVVFLNDDTEVASDWLRRLLEVAESRPDVGGVHAAQQFDWSAPEAGAEPPLMVPDFCRWGFIRYRRVQRYDAPLPTLHLSGASVMLRRQWIERDGGPFDESFFMYGEDRDLGLRLNNQGYTVLAVPAATLRHHQSNTLTHAGKASRTARLAARNGWRAYLKNMYLSEFVLYAPAVCIGSLLKGWEFPGSFPRRLLAGLALLALTLAYLPAALWHYKRHPEQRQRVLAQRRRPRGWLLRQLWDR
jgi:GT2 family glycosyltransferase